jgi:hypothetical protein
MRLRKLAALQFYARADIGLDRRSHAQGTDQVERKRWAGPRKR